MTALPAIPESSTVFFLSERRDRLGADSSDAEGGAADREVDDFFAASRASNVPVSREALSSVSLVAASVTVTRAPCLYSRNAGTKAAGNSNTISTSALLSALGTTGSSIIAQFCPRLTVYRT